MRFRLEPIPPKQITGAFIALVIIAWLIGCYFSIGIAWRTHLRRADQAGRLGAKQAVLKKAAASGVPLRIDKVTRFSRCGWCHFQIEPEQLAPLLREFRFYESGSYFPAYRFEGVKLRKGTRVFSSPIRVSGESGGVLNQFLMLYSPDTGDVYMSLCYAYG